MNLQFPQNAVNVLIIRGIFGPESSLWWPARRWSAQNASVSYLSRFWGQRWRECSSMGAFLGSFVAGICLDRTFLDLGSVLDFGVTYTDWIPRWCHQVWCNHLKNIDYFTIFCKLWISKGMEPNREYIYFEPECFAMNSIVKITVLRSILMMITSYWKE